MAREPKYSPQDRENVSKRASQEPGLDRRVCVSNAGTIDQQPKEAITMRLPLCLAARSFKSRQSVGLFAVISLLILLVSLTGCVTTNFTQPVASFKQSVNTSTAAIGAYYTNLNEFERQLYVDNIALDPTLEVGEVQNGKPTPLVGEVFQPASIKARMDALSLLGVYAQRLTDLADSDAPQQVSTDAKALGQSLTDLDKTFSQLSGKGDNAAAAYVGPISSLLGSIGKMYEQQQINKDLHKVITDGSQRVDAILDLIQGDLASVVKPLETTGLHEKLVNRITYYNNNRNSMNLQQRQSSLSDIAASASAYEATVVFNPATVTDSIRQANHALLKYATAPTNPQNFNDLLTALRAFEQNSQEVAANVQKLIQVMGGK
jgi:hypothetical protein